MTIDSWQDKMIGKVLPSGLARIEWQSAGAGRQEVGVDSTGNAWRREKHTPTQEKESVDQPISGAELGCEIWTALDSEHRENVRLTVVIRVDDKGIIDDVEILAVGSHGPCYGRPAYLEPESSEEDQVGDMLVSLFD